MYYRLRNSVGRVVRYCKQLRIPLIRSRDLAATARRVYNYHNLGVGVFPDGEEKTPHGSGERYNFDRMYFMVSTYDFTGKHVLDLGCNSGWFSLQAKLLGSAKTVGIDYEGIGVMGGAIEYALQLERRLKLGLAFLNANLETLDLQNVARNAGVQQFDTTLLLSVFHHIAPGDEERRRRFFQGVFDVTRDVIFYEDHEFWNQIIGDDGTAVAVKGTGHRFGWNEDMTWQRRMASLERHEHLVLEQYLNSWRKETLMLHRFAQVRLLGFSEKRRPVLGLFKSAVTQ